MKNGLDCHYFILLFLSGIHWISRDKQHIGIVLGLGGLYPAREIVQAILAPGGETKSILDLGG